ncbi:choice-of-anchor L domain-containing protein [Flavobacterium tegetincola]|uniref:choice-of-anchor L domain-containing protein n=1 Tax=Flavobacterium tegetincola TaxID=150172 RepID=UPI000428D3C3|nr:choice-of-anchor L domain-containing protein [Flavobacterium tegetincola]
MKRILLLFLLLISSYVSFSQADITVTNTDGFTVFIPGVARVYTVTVTNNGPMAAENLVVQGTLTAGIDLANVTWSGNNSTSGTGILNATIATMAVGSTVIYTVNVPVPSNFSQTTNLVHQVSTSSTTTDPDPSCIACTDTDTPTPFADLVTVKTNNQTQYLVGETTVYVITVNNIGPSDAVNVNVSDAIPVGLNPSQMSWTSSTGASGTGALNQTVPALPVGETLTYNVSIAVPTNYSGNLINQVIVSSGTTDPEINCPACIDVDTPLPDFVTIDSSTYTTQQLIKDVLINEPCVQLSNFTSSATTNAAAAAGFGAFKRNNSNFPFKEGIIIRSGNASFTEGKYTGASTGSTGSNQSDPDLDVINGNSSSRDRSFVKFNFVPTVQNFSFNFLFASNEYGTFQCSFGDTFAFILTNLSTGVSSNLAIVPGSVNAANPNGTRVSVVTIRDAANNGGCSSVNPLFFERFNATGTGPNAGPASSAINMRGQTVSMTASADVIPGTEYSIKLVIADHNDTAFDSAVFLEAGSFVIGGPRITGTGIFTSGTEFTGDEAFCEGAPQMIQAGTGPVAGVTYSWFKDGVLIAGATSYNLEVTEAGTYTVIFSYGNGCQQSDDVIIEFKPTDFPLMEDADDLYVCNSATPTFNLTLNAPIVMAAYDVNDFDTYYYTSLAAAQDPVGVAIPSSQVAAYPGIDGQQIWMKMVNIFSGGNCDPIKTFKLFLTAAPSGAFSYADDDGEPGFCINSNNNLLPTLLDLSAGGSYSAEPAGLTIDPDTGALDLTTSSAGTYLVSYIFNASGCDPFTATTTVIVDDCLATVASNSGNVCQGTLTFGLSATPAGAGATYEWKDYNGVVISSEQFPMNVPVPGAAGSYIYSVVASLNGSSSDVSTTTIVVHPTPTANFVSVSSTICTNSSLTIIFSGTPGAIISFTDGATTYQVTIDGSGSGQYLTSVLATDTTFTLVSVIGTTVPACSANLTGSILISVGLPTATIVGFTEAVICSGTETGLAIQGTPGSTVTYTKDGVVQPTVLIGAAGTATILTGVQTVTATTTFTYELTNVVSNSTPPCSDAITGQTANLTVNALPTATFTATTASVCEGTAAILNFIGTPNAAVTYSNGTTEFTVVLNATGTATVTTDFLSVDTTFTLIKIEVTNTVLCSNTLSGTVPITIDKNPAITVQPIGVTKCVGESVTFTVAATGANLTYQWFFNGVSIAGATNASYTIATLATANDGDYTVEVSGTCGTKVVSDPAVLVMTEETIITVPPVVSQTVCEGDLVTISVTATGTNLTYQWFKGATAVAGATSSTLTIATATPANAGIYTCVITNPCQVVTTTTSELIVNTLPAIVTQPVGSTICEGTGINLSVTTTGTGLTYQWFLNGIAIPAATTSTYADASVSLAEAGNYTVVVSGSCNPAVTSSAAAIVVNQPATITIQPVPNTTVCSGTPVMLSIVTNGGTGVTYQWFQGATAIPGATASTYTIGSSIVADSGNYTCQVTVASCGTITSEVAVVVVNQAPAITNQPQDKEICVGQTATFNVVATGTNLTYQWFKGTTAIAGATASTYSIANATEADSGDFYCVITSASCPDIQTTTVTLLVKPLPFATIAAGNPSTICAGESTQVLFTGTAGAVVIYTINGGSQETITLNGAGNTILPTGILNKTTVYTLVSVTYTGADACSQALVGSVTINVNPLPKVALEDGKICVDLITLATTRNYLLNTGLNEAEFTFEWSDVSGIIPLATNSFYDVSVAGQYSVTITNIITGCQATAFATVGESSPPTDFDYTVSGFFANNPTVVITASPAGNYEYQLDFGPFQESNIFDNISAGTHTITVRDPEACDVLTKQVLIVDYPRYFTPNGDGINDTWNIPSINGISFTKIYIFDRFGKLVKEMTASGSGWDGTYNGQQLPATDYWFTLNYQEDTINKEFRAHFSLKR